MNRQNKNDQLRVGLAQISPVWLHRDQTIDKVISWVEKAAAENCKLVVFGETLVPGYPFWLSNTGGAEFDSLVQKEIHAVYLDEAVSIADGHLDPIAQVARENDIHIMLGCFERASDRGGHTGYCSLVRIGADGNVHNVHRKLMPTYEERLAWGIGDGHGLTVKKIGPFTMGGLNCWENWMPLVRSSLYAQGEDLHVAVWPGCKRNTTDITRFIAFESRSFVLSVSGTLKRSEIPVDMPHRDLILEHSPEIISDGGSCIAGPDGNWIVAPVDSSEQLIVTTIDHSRIREERQNFDVSGHYSRPDVMQLHVNRERQSLVKFENGEQ